MKHKIEEKFLRFAQEHLLFSVNVNAEIFGFNTAYAASCIVAIATSIQTLHTIHRIFVPVQIW